MARRVVRFLLLVVLAISLDVPKAAQARTAGGAAAAAAAVRQRRPRHALLAGVSTGSSSGGIDTSSIGSSRSGAADATRDGTAVQLLGKCRPTLLDVARRQPQLRQLVALAGAGFNVFAADTNKPFTVLAPTNDALQALAEDTEYEEQQQLQDGFYAIILYHQLPQGAFNLSDLILLGRDGLQTSLGRLATSTKSREKYDVSVDNSTAPPVITGGWPANNAQVLASYEACHGWIHILDTVLLPTQKLSNLPRLVDDIPDLQNGSFWGLLDGSESSLDVAQAPSSAFYSPEEVPAAGMGSSGGSSGAEGSDAGSTGSADSADSGSNAAGDTPRHSNSTTDTVVSSGSGNGNGSAVGQAQGLESPAGSSSDGGGGRGGSSSSNEKVLVIAASAAGAAVAACAAIVAVVLIRKRMVRRRQKRHGRLGGREEEEEDGEANAPAKRTVSLRPVQLHVDA